MKPSVLSLTSRWLVAASLTAVLGSALASELPQYRLTVKAGKFIPETVEVPAGQKFRLMVTNEGPGPEEFESHELNREKVIPAGRTAPIIIGPLDPGSYGFFGDFHPNTATGKIVAK